MAHTHATRHTPHATHMARTTGHTRQVHVRLDTARTRQVRVQAVTAEAACPVGDAGLEVVAVAPRVWVEAPRVVGTHYRPEVGSWVELEWTVEERGRERDSGRVGEERE